MSLIDKSVQDNTLQGTVINQHVYRVLYKKCTTGYVDLNETPLKSRGGSQTWRGDGHSSTP
jgi:hypothetical protein